MQFKNALEAEKMNITSSIWISWVCYTESKVSLFNVFQSFNSNASQLLKETNITKWDPPLCRMLAEPCHTPSVHLVYLFTQETRDWSYFWMNSGQGWSFNTSRAEQLICKVHHVHYHRRGDIWRKEHWSNCIILDFCRPFHQGWRLCLWNIVSIERDGHASRNISIQFPCVCVCLSFCDLFNSW